VKHPRTTQRRGRWLLACAAIVSATLAIQTIATGVPTASSPDPGSPFKHVFVVMVENTNWSSVKGSSSYPYVNGTLLPNYAHTENYFTHNHPSLPNYITLEAGDNLGLTSGAYLPADHPVTADHLTTQLNIAGVSWKYYAENLPGNGTICNTSDPGTPYSQDHNSFTYFTDVKDNAPYCIAHERPFPELLGDPSSIPQYSFIVPNDYNQGEKSNSSCTACQADTFLKNTVPAIQATAAYADGGLILVLWDEAGSSANPDTTPSGLIAVSALSKPGYASTLTYSHGSTVRSLQEIFGVGPFLGSAGSATDLSDLFTQPLVGSLPTPPVAAFTATPPSGVAPLSVDFADTSTGAPTWWAWDFGDGSTSTVQSPTHMYAAAGTYLVRLTASNLGGPTTATSTVTVSPPVVPLPLASFIATPLSGVAPLRVDFADTSTGDPTSWVWDFGDGGTATAQSPTHTYGAAGSYVVRLSATNPGGTTTATTTVTVSPAISSTVVDRVNAGGALIAGGWTADTKAVPSNWVNNAVAKTSNASTTSQINVTDPSIPVGTPMSIFQTGRFDRATGTDMVWTLPVPSAGRYTVRLYFAETYWSARGKRVFSVKINGVSVLTSFDIVAAAGAPKKGIVRTFTVDTSGPILVTFGRTAIDNPLVNGIEVLTS